MADSKEFKLKSASEGFASRSKDIFANIDSLASTKSEPEPVDKQDKQKQPREEKSDERRQDKDKYTQDFKGRESIYRSPNESGWPPSRSDFRRPYDKFDNRRNWNDRKRPRGPKKVPDHVVNPNKYTKYDLSDVSKDQMSDRSNTRAAFDFLRELKHRKDEQEDCHQDREKVQEGQISFKKPTFKKKSSNELGSTNVVRDGNKRVMPECVVGQKKTSSKSKSEKSKIKSTSSISLSHLDEEDDE